MCALNFSRILSVGVDTDTLFAHLYMKDFDSMKFEGYAKKKMRLTENGVAYIFVDREMQKKYGLTSEQASACVSYMESIRGSLIWVAFIEHPDKDEIRVRMRSRFVPVSDRAERYRGGGHACAAGATLFEKSEIDLVLAEADKKLKEYKESHEGWL